ncbi:MAG: multidrug ABC transporter permease [Nitrospirae bacterium RIFCSPHIGHO2_01_FULL_66_17]|nr:MAG: multidrug ABC transporter permease [Nitrospirae bacterium RIFCSPHIGHO2_01_FULL_66_17]
MAIPIQYSLRNLWTRRLTTAMTAAGLALVVFVFAAVLMLAHGLERTLVTTGEPDNVLVVRRSATSEVQSFLAREQTRTIATSQEISTGVDGAPLAGAETVAIINLPKRGTGRPSNVQIRGASPHAMTLRPQVKLVEGRMWRPGSSEVVVGRAVASRFQGAGLGETMRFALREWTVVGIFDAGGSAFDSEIWVDADQMMQAFRRTVFSSVLLRLRDPAEFDALKARLEADPRLTVDVRRETAYYGAQSEVMANFIRVLGLMVTVIFSLGAVIGAMITMYAAVANRTTEIGTMRALGFPRRAIWTAFVVEALALSAAGWLLGILAASGLQVVSISAMNFATFTEIAFRFILSPAIALQSLIFALVMGLFGGVLPAVRASRLGIVQALRMP